MKLPNLCPLISVFFLHILLDGTTVQHLTAGAGGATGASRQGSGRGVWC